MQKPSVGRVVHYQSHGSPNGQHKSEPRAAIITALVQPTSDTGLTEAGVMLPVDLCIMNPSGLFFDRATPYSEEPKAGHWNWPPRV